VRAQLLVVPGTELVAPARGRTQLLTRGRGAPALVLRLPGAAQDAPGTALVRASGLGAVQVRGAVGPAARPPRWACVPGGRNWAGGLRRVLVPVLL